MQEAWSFVNLVVRSPNPAALVDSLRRAVAEVDADMPADDAGTIRQFIDRTQHNMIVVGKMLAGFAALGLVLAAVGLYGVISNLVAQRTTEFGIRMALGAQPGDVLRHVLDRGLRLALIGIGLGLVGAFGLGRFLASIMPRLATADPLALVLVSILLFIVTLVACCFPPAGRQPWIRWSRCARSSVRVLHVPASTGKRAVAPVFNFVPLAGIGRFVSGPPSGTKEFPLISSR